MVRTTTGTGDTCGKRPLPPDRCGIDRGLHPHHRLPRPHRYAGAERGRNTATVTTWFRGGKMEPGDPLALGGTQADRPDSRGWGETLLLIHGGAKAEGPPCSPF